MKKSTIICAAVLAVTVIVMAVLIIVGINRNKPVITDEPPKQTETTVPDNTTIPDTSETKPPVVVPPVIDDKPTGDLYVTVDLDVGGMTKNPEPEVVSGNVEYETKD